MSHRKRAVKPLIARRAFLSQASFQVTLHACIPACDSTFQKFNRITVYFYKSPLSRRTFPRMRNARPCDFGSQFIRGQLDLFSLRSRDCAFSAQFQRKFSANHAKSAYFQRKSRKVSVKHSFSVRLSANLTDNARPSMQKTSWASIFRFLSIHLLILKNFYYPVDLSVISGV